jgi:hypothetical protein
MSPQTCGRRLEPCPDRRRSLCPACLQTRSRPAALTRSLRTGVVCSRTFAVRAAGRWVYGLLSSRCTNGPAFRSACTVGTGAARLRARAQVRCHGAEPYEVSSHLRLCRLTSRGRLSDVPVLGHGGLRLSGSLRVALTACPWRRRRRLGAVGANRLSLGERLQELSAGRRLWAARLPVVLGA